MHIFYTYCTEEYSAKRYVVNLHITLNSGCTVLAHPLFFLSEI